VNGLFDRLKGAANAAPSSAPEGSVLTWADRDQWPLPHFRPSELACKGSGALKIDLDAGLALERLRSYYGAPVYVVSAYRSVAHNRAVGGATNSFHLQGKAFDLRYSGGADGRALVGAGIEAGFTGLGFYKTFIHFDVGPPRLWVG
jgi:zinc D-Ala-D-Ala carboxypeptidase